ncbi:retinoic acid receptor responder protein 1 [Suricata suricatta]|uniref:retinoic acid receptor responder protein 1 n=1 Tax=Suricata suricatta TaxID=37032 RepID=UPI001155F013|nr:retinoic acid receptor responder protein 1 [Suricata suricatta]
MRWAKLGVSSWNMGGEKASPDALCVVLSRSRSHHMQVSPEQSFLGDSHGHTDPSLRPIWDLAFLGGSYVMWEKTAQFSHYYMAQLSSVNQWKTNDDAIDFDYTVLLHEFSTQEIIPCRIHLVWYPGKPLKVKYRCQELQTPKEASGNEEGSAVAPTELNNF